MVRSHRDEFPRKVRALVFARSGGLCEGCGAKLKVGEGEIDHVIPVVFGGEPTAANAKLLCRPCHATKTAADASRKAKSNRQRDDHTGAVRPAAEIKSAPFARTPKSVRRAKNLQKRDELASYAAAFNPALGRSLHGGRS